MTDYTPIERGAEAIAGEYDRRNRYKPGTWWGALHRRANLRMEARAVFESIDREGLARVLADHPDQYDFDCGVDYPCPCGAGEGFGGDRDPEFSQEEHMADAIRAWLLSEGVRNG